MHLKMAARKSDLARMQLQTVASFLKEKLDVEVELIYRESFGDQNLDINLAGSENKGLFTQDFYESLVQKKIDLVVHSWKDLPIEDRETRIVMTLPREDCRDVLLVKKNNLDKIAKSKKIEILTSSPRREFFLQNHLAELYPGGLDQIAFQPIRGNIPTRLTKMLKSSSDGLVIAKAALDRMLSAEAEEFVSVKKEISETLEHCQWMVLPLSLFPSAAAQGALAVEVLKGTLIEKKLEELNFKSDFNSVAQERAKLKKMGGGCHSRLGVNYLPRPYGTVHYFSQEENGKLVAYSELHSKNKYKSVDQEATWPQKGSVNSVRTLRAMNSLNLESHAGLWVARSLALPENYQPSLSQKIWTSGVMSWKKLAQRGIWVNGCSDSLGEKEDMRLNHLLSPSFSWTKLTHSKGVESQHKLLATYDVDWNFSIESLKEKTHFFWMSGRLFEAAIKLCPEIIKGTHFCGPGHTYDILKKYIPTEKIHVTLGFDLWKKEVSQ